MNSNSCNKYCNSCCDKPSSPRVKYQNNCYKPVDNKCKCLNIYKYNSDQIKQKILLNIQDNYKLELANIINENINLTSNILVNLATELYNQDITIFSHGHHTERILLCALLNKNLLVGPLSSLIKYVFDTSDPNTVAIYIFKLGVNTINDYYVLFNNSGLVNSETISSSCIDSSIKPLLYDLITRHTNIEIFRIHLYLNSCKLISGDVSINEDNSTNTFKNLFYNFQGLSKYKIFNDTYYDNYGFKFSSWLHYL